MEAEILGTATPEPLPVEESFEDILAKFSYTPASEEGAGFLPVIGRSSGHLLYLVGRYEDKTKPTTSKAKEEIEGALGHWSNLVVEDYFSTKAKTEIGIIDTLLRRAQTDIESWTNEEVSLRVQSITNRMIQLLANLDREVLGIRGSDAGFNL